NINSNTTEILLKGTDLKAISTKEIAKQIEAKKGYAQKLPTWFNTSNIYYLNILNIEQTCSDITTNSKKNLTNGKDIVDLNDEFDVDAFYFSKYFESVVHCELDSNLSDIVKHKYKQLQVSNINVVNTDGLEYLEKTNETFDWIYADPSRRHDSKGKVF